MFKGFYTGVGSRETPEHICRLMKDIAAVAAIRGYTGRSGGADRADDAFETGFLAVADSLAIDNMAEFDVYIPWKRFNGRFAPKHARHNIILPGANAWDAEQIMKTVHPIYKSGGQLRGGALALHTRNVPQVLGYDLKTPSEFLVCYSEPTKDGVKGGTNTAWQLGLRNGVECYNLYNPYDTERIKDFLDL
ncbi:hypothetical protein OFDDKENP_00117 [Aeromonas phage B614]|nr:hypothetical protein OFDDKENP_00117 [Aeromonas phage B614]UYD58156.1 hypothetical protein JNEOFJEA_00059 [Aeromonas phage UP87]UYD58519.1 hypothetical protein IPAKJDPM_00176 [Aeromonas phage avDM14-QBC]UYD58734.1 hypothetical protein HNNIDBEH_00141 [Aeromonas phage avDM10-HWA]UYD58962.1 hypothetical protein OFOPOMKI_00112 [Aeromonas phage avDM7-IJDJ]UYD60021.1 hypothetical protein LEHPIFIF_00265 [Aeromonas phage avDM9-HANS]